MGWVQEQHKKTSNSTKKCCNWKKLASAPLSKKDGCFTYCMIAYYLIAYMHIQSLGERLACCHTLLCCSPSTQRSIFNTLFQVLCQPQLSHRKFNRDLNHSASGPARCFLPPCSSVIPRERRNYVILAWSRIIHKNFELHFLMLVLMKQSPPQPKTEAAA